MFIFFNKRVYSSAFSVTTNLQAASGWSTGLKAEFKNPGLACFASEKVSLLRSQARFLITHLFLKYRYKYSIPWALLGAASSSDSTTSSTIFYKLLPACAFLGACWGFAKFYNRRRTFEPPRKDVGTEYQSSPSVSSPVRKDVGTEYQSFPNLSPTPRTANYWFLPNAPYSPHARDWTYQLYRDQATTPRPMQAYHSALSFQHDCMEHTHLTMTLVHKSGRVLTKLAKALTSESQGLDEARFSELRSTAWSAVRLSDTIPPTLTSVQEHVVYSLCIEFAKVHLNRLYLADVMRVRQKTFTYYADEEPQSAFAPEHVQDAQVELGFLSPIFDQLPASGRVVFTLLYLLTMYCYFWCPELWCWLDTLTVRNGRRFDAFFFRLVSSLRSFIYQSILRPVKKFVVDKAHSFYQLPIWLRPKLAAKTLRNKYFYTVISQSRRGPSWRPKKDWTLFGHGLFQIDLPFGAIV